ncbi:MAG: class I SAM-dependent methyltransferase [Deltaproteobacteria bacterium]|nr:class I SAM-dependent methyltransferase [Deltaproteobacteria bacterium]
MAQTPDPSHYDGHDLEALADMPRYNAWIDSHFAPWLHGRVIEVGAGIGNFSATWLPRATAAVLVEPAANLAPRLTSRFAADRRVQVANTLLADLPTELRAAPFDAAVMVNVLEHIADDAAVLRQLHGLLRPGGAVCVFVPALPALFGSLDEVFDHVRRYRKLELADRMRAAGFEVERAGYMDSAGAIPWFVAGRLLRQRRLDGRATVVYDRAVVPVVRALEAVVAPPVGKSLWAVGVRL